MISHKSTLTSGFLLAASFGCCEKQKSLYSAGLKISLRIFQLPYNNFPQTPKQAACNKLI
jgi:hypothetical protein